MMYRILLLVCLSNFAFAQQALRTRLLGHWNDTNLAYQVNNFSNDRQIWSDLIGWTDPRNQKEYIIMGSIDSTYFFDVTDPANIRKCDVEFGIARSVNRDYDVYDHYVYCVSDNGAPGLFQIYDLQYLPDSVHLIFADSSISSRTHSLFIDSTSKRLYFQSAGVGDKRYDLLILSLDPPEQPKVIGRLQHPACGRVHEAYYRNDTAYCSCEYRGLHVFDMRKADSILYIGGISPPYPFNGYNHTSWLSPDGKFIAFTDEIPEGLPIKLYSVSDSKRDYDFEAAFNSNKGATPHNVIWIDNYLYTSAYEDGFVLWDMSVPFNPQKIAYYDTYPQNQPGDYNGFTGCWGVYPFFKSGHIAASDMRNGLFMLEFDITLGREEVSLIAESFNLFPNPSSHSVSLSVTLSKAARWTTSITDINGKLISEQELDLQEGKNEVKLEEVSGMNAGMYFVHLQGAEGAFHRSLVKF